MKKRATPQRKSTATEQRRGGGLMVIDEGPIRAEALAGYRKLEDEVGQVQNALEHFETVDLPAYQRWEARAFGSLMTELRNLSTELAEKDYTVRAIHEEVFWTGCSEVTAYKRVMKVLQEPDEPEEESPPPVGGGDDPEPGDDSGYGPRLFGETDLPEGMTAADFDRLTPREKSAFREMYEEMAALFELATGRLAPDLNDVLREQRTRARHSRHETAGDESKHRSAGGGPPPGPAPPPGQARASTPAQRVSERIKELYRQLVRQLHPDHNREQTPRERELWHQLQTAYRTGDLESMEALAGRVELSRQRLAVSLPFQVLLRLARDLRDSLKSLRAQLAVARKNPAWHFGQRLAELPKLEAKHRHTLERDLQQKKTELDNLLRYLASLQLRAAPRPNRPTRPPKRTATSQTSFEF